MGTVYAFAKVLQAEPVGTRWNPRRNPHSLVGTAYAVAKVYNMEPAGTRGGTRGGTRTFSRTPYAKLKFLVVPHDLFILLN